MMKVFCILLSQTVAMNGMWRLRTWHVASDTEELSFKFYFILIYIATYSSRLQY